MKKLPKTITLAFLKKHFEPFNNVFDFWNKNFAINNKPTLKEFYLKFYKTDPQEACGWMEKVIIMYLNKDTNRLYYNICHYFINKSIEDWYNIDCAFIDFLYGELSST